MGTRLKWTAALRAEKNWPVYVLRMKAGRPRQGVIGRLIKDEVMPFVNENFGGEYMTHIISRDYEAIIAIRDHDDAVRLRLWFNHPDVDFTRLKKQQRNANGY